jgi:hypothetical protein
MVRDGRILHIEEILFTDIIRMMKSGAMRWAENAARTWS